MALNSIAACTSYCALTTALQALRQQREQALHDIARLAILRERALAAPVPFVLRLKMSKKRGAHIPVRAHTITSTAHTQGLMCDV